jgi:hypothetical protein
MKKLYAFLVVTAMVNPVLAEGDQIMNDSSVRRRGPHYFFTVGMGAMIGCEQCHVTGKTASFSSSTIHGLRFGKRLSLGAGLGFDAYENWKTMPLFGSASWDLFGKKSRAFVQLNYGYAGAWVNKSYKGNGFKNDKGGKMINPSVGYRFSGGDIRVSFSIGYKLQQAFANYEYPASYRYQPPCINCDFRAPASQSKKEVMTNMNRFVFDMTIGWK